MLEVCRIGGQRVWNEKYTLITADALYDIVFVLLGNHSMITIKHDDLQLYADLFHVIFIKIHSNDEQHFVYYALRCAYNSQQAPSYIVRESARTT